MKRIDDGNTLRLYLSRLSRVQQEQYAAACGTTVNYLRKHLCRRTRMDVPLMARLVAQSQGRVTFDSLRADVDWDEVRRLLTRAQARRSSARDA